MCGASGLGIACGGALSLDGVARSSDLQSNATLGGSRKMSTMKQLMTFGAAALCAAVSLADVESANIVGYNTINITKEYSLLSVVFDEVDGTELSIQKAFPFSDGMTKGLTSANGDNIQIMKEDGDYDIYFLSDGHYGKGGASYNPDLDGKWSADGKNEISDRTLKSGTTFWYLARSAKNKPFALTVAGSVHSAESETYIINKSYTLIGCPYPAEVAINGGIEITGGTTGLTSANGDNIQIMKDDGDYAIYFLSNGHYGKGGASYDENLDGKWSADGQNSVTSDKFPVGKGAWYLSRSKEGTVKFLNPIAK